MPVVATDSHAPVPSELSLPASPVAACESERPLLGAGSSTSTASIDEDDVGGVEEDDDSADDSFGTDSEEGEGTGFNDDLDDEDDELDEFDDIDEDDFDDNFDDDFEEELEDDYEIEIDDEISAEFGLGSGIDDDDVLDDELEDFDDFDSVK